MSQDESMSELLNKSFYYLNEYDDNNFTCLRVRGSLKCNRIVSANSSDDKELIRNQFDEILNKDLPSINFYIEKSNILLSKDNLLKTSNHASKEDSITCADLFSSNSSNKTIEASLRNFIPVQILKNLTSPSDSVLTSPIFTNHKGICRLQIYEIPIDLLVLINNLNLKLEQLYALIIEKLSLHLDTIKQCYVAYYKYEKNFKPDTYHFIVDDENIITIVYPNNRTDEDLKPVRQEIHKSLNLPLDRPYFRRIDAFEFEPVEIPGIDSSFIMNVHQHVKPSGVKDGKQSLVKGNYIYYHYMQSNINDNGWGCAYRSFQTIFSWFKLQKYINAPVPTHREIQQALYEIGDKPRDFVGSSKWIGSMEISFCLSKMIGVESKIINVSSGSEIAEKARELQYHFETEGTPVMIGGGVLAHTIAGVDFNELTGDVKFLVLDPHYTGDDDIKTISNKGWCGWKDVKFWDENVYYNMCCPLRTQLI